MKYTIGLVVCIAQLATANPFFSFNRRAECAKGLYILYARGTGEPQDTGMTHGISVDIAKRIPGSKVVPVVYPATFTAPPYQDSVADGVKNMQERILQYAKDCPDGKMALLGYSQGATLPWTRSAEVAAASSTRYLRSQRKLSRNLVSLPQSQLHSVTSSN